MTRFTGTPWRPGALLTVALLLLLSAGAVRERQQFLSRGIPSELPEPIRHGGVEVGLNVALQQVEEEELDDELQRIAATGVTHVKQPFFYDERFEWSVSDRIVDVVADYELVLVALLDGNPDDDYAPPDDPHLFAAWAGDFATRYGSQIRYYFIWDEPNLSSHWGLQPVNAVEYSALLSASARAIRAADSDAVIVAAPLAPTSETGPANLSDVLYLRELYAAGAQDFFDVAAGKPYGFNSGPYDRTLGLDELNFSRAILLREVMQEHGDGNKALFAGNWGWNSLPADWPGSQSIWGQVDAQTRVTYTGEALQRASREWPWMGLMFLESWRAPGPTVDPRHGFDVANSPLEEALRDLLLKPDLAYPGFHLALPNGPGQDYEGSWRFSPQFGADISQTGDALTYRFWGTAAGLRVRRADYRARLYVTVDGEPAPELPNDSVGAALVLTAPDPNEDYLEIIPIAQDLRAGPHVMTVEAYRGWDQWALNGFSIGYAPDDTTTRATVAILLFGAAIVALAGIQDLRRVSWASTANSWSRRIERFDERSRLLLTFVAAALVTLTGWLTWGEQAAGIYRRLGDSGQLVLTAAAASLFYVTPAFFLYLLALLFLFFFVYARPAWGLALVALFIPFYVLPKPMGVYRFSPVEIFVLLTAAATSMGYARRLRRKLVATVRDGNHPRLFFRRSMLHLRDNIAPADYAVGFFVVVATVSLLFTERLDVAQNEWRVVIIEPALLYVLLRMIRPRPREMWTIIDAFVLGGVIVAVYGLWQYALGQNVITVDGGLSRLRSIYGSPNNVALYLGRILPFLFALTLMGWAAPRRRLLYGLALVPVGVALSLTLSKGALFLGVPAGLGLVFLLWLRDRKRALWPWIVGGGLLLVAVAVAAVRVPGIEARLDVQGATSILRLSLWQASLNMFADHPFFGVGLDNFLYAYRGRYILESGWEEPNLNHPHNIALDFATRLGIAGIIAGVWLFTVLLKNLWRLPARLNDEWRPVAIAVAGTVTQMLAHGLVDHSFFLVDLAYTFFLILGLVVWLRQTNTVTNDLHAG